MALEDGLLEFWTLNDTLTGAVAGTTLVASDGGTHYETGLVGKSWDFAATANRALYANPSPWNPSSGDWTILARVRVPTAFAATTRVLSVRDGTTNRFQLNLTAAYFLTEEEGGPLWAIQGTFGLFGLTPTGWLVEGDDVAEGQWVNLVVRYASSTGEWNLWVNGRDQMAGTRAAVATSSPNVVIGASRPSAEGTNSPYRDRVDCVGLWSRRLSDSEVAELYNSGAGWEYSPPTPPAEPKISATLLIMIEESSGRITEKRIPLGVA